MSQLHISISAEPIFSLGGFNITNSMLTSVLVTVLFILLILIVSKTTRKSTKPPKKYSFQSIVEFTIESFYEFVKGVVGPVKARVFFPLIATLFFYILVANWMGLLPGIGSIGLIKPVEAESTFVPLFRGATADINTTLALAVISMVMVQFYGFRYLGLHYLTKFFNFKSVMGFFIGILELFSEFSKIISFTFRLFGNIFAGEVLLSVIAFLVPIFAPLPFLGLEVFVGVIQALVFAMLTLVFINMATISHEEEY